MARKQNQKTSGGQDKNRKKSHNRNQAGTQPKKQDRAKPLPGDEPDFDSVLPSYGSFLKDMQYEDDWGGGDWDDDDTPIEKKVAAMKAEKAEAKKKKQSRNKKSSDRPKPEKKPAAQAKTPVRHEDERLFDDEDDRGLTLDEFEAVGTPRGKGKQSQPAKKAARAVEQTPSKNAKSAKKTETAKQRNDDRKQPKASDTKAAAAENVATNVAAAIPSDMQAVSKGGGVSLRIDASKSVSSGSTRRRKRAAVKAPESGEKSTPDKIADRDGRNRGAKKTPESKAAPDKPAPNKQADRAKADREKRDVDTKSDGKTKPNDKSKPDAAPQSDTVKKAGKKSKKAAKVAARESDDKAMRAENAKRDAAKKPERDKAVTPEKQAPAPKKAAQKDDKRASQKDTKPESKAASDRETKAASPAKKSNRDEKNRDEKSRDENNRDRDARRAAVEQAKIAALAAEAEGKDEPTAFGDLKLSKVMLESLKAANYREPSPVQAGVIPDVLAGRDVMGQARTGTGKTAAFVIPILEGLDECDSGDEPVALVLVPTRELAVQVRDEAEKLATGRKVRTIACYGGKPIGQQIAKLKKGVDIVVGTPGRVLDLSRRGALTLDSLIWVVLDEADRMLDIGFRPDIEKILRLTPSDRQTLLLSATLPPEVVKLAERYMRNPKVIDFSDKQMAVETIEQYYITIDRDRKLDGLICLIKEQNPQQAIVFCRTKRGADRVKRQLEGTFKSLESLHGDMTQGVRDRVMAKFRAGKLQILVATDVVGRGIDISGISHIINYDIPQFCDDYVHRVGRTGRMGREGTAFTFVTAEEGQELTRIEMRINRQLKRAELPDFEAVSQIVPQEKEPPKPVFGKPTRRVRRAL